ncbi:MAG: tRNA pseudouridine(38-40) synthase TruA [Rickettsiales bacterium]|jgi:tRNA pseudouridine38-40 synthase|nr:tRNA pseudouridine(38-40) synthase TruA [Rickettsiales bacterium]
MPLTRYKLTIEYDGTLYAGFQIQKDVKTIASALTEAIFNVSRESISITCTGRTDSGVHAEGQVIHFDLEKILQEYQMVESLNFYLRNEQVVVTKCEIVDQNFDARRSSKSKIYRYQILNRHAPSALLANRAWPIKKPLNLNAMIDAAEYLVGEHDFSSFRASGCQAKHAIRRLKYIKFSQNGDLILCHIKGNAFLHNMVRIIIGSLVEVGLGKWPSDQIKQILAAKDRITAGQTAPSCGLYLQEILFND